MTAADHPGAAPGTWPSHRGLDPDTHVHLIGIGGAGMSALARIMLERGLNVSGSDLRGGRECNALTAMGARVAIGHRAANVEGADVVAVSTAIPASNPELVRARQLGIAVVRRADLLVALMAGRRPVLIAGTHGKTTTTSMTTVALQAVGADPSFAIGGTLHDSGTSAHDGSGELFVAEADESDRSFLAYRSDCAVVTNVELDHHDSYRDLTDVEEAFAAFLDRRAPGAPAILCIDDVGSRRLSEQADPKLGPVLTYGEDEAADLRIVDVRLDATGSSFRLLDRGQDLGGLRLRIPGRHNIANAAAAMAVVRWAGVDSAVAAEGLARFGGAQRRFQRLGTAAGITVVDDYGHHPTELSVTLAAARQTRPPGRIIAVFQPHRYSRTAALGPELGAALAAADVAVITDVYPAGEAPVPGVTGALVADVARSRGVETHFVPTTGELPPLLAELARDGDLVLTLGAGDITGVGPQLLQILEGRRG